MDALREVHQKLLKITKVHETESVSLLSLRLFSFSLSSVRVVSSEWECRKRNHLAGVREGSESH